jgi:hypothetical protein
MITLFDFKRLFFISALGLSIASSAQSPVFVKIPVTEDADIFSRKDKLNTNLGDEININPAAWTWDADNLGNGVSRSLVKLSFEGIPAGAEILSVKLKLFYAPTGGMAQGAGHSSLSGSNAAWISKVTSAWKENTVTWSNQPTITTAGRVAVPQSSSSTQNYSLDITELGKGIFLNPGSDFGIMISHQAESPYRQLVFASSDYSSADLRPYIEVSYLEPCVSNKLISISPAADAEIFSRADQVDVNRGNETNINPCAWTWDADKLGKGVFRSLIRFDYGTIPTDAVINSAKLKLFYVSTGGATTGHSGSNACYLSSVESSWEENKVTWKTQPSFNVQGQVSVPASTSNNQDYSIDITELVKEALANPMSDFGFMLRLQNEVEYKQLVFGSREFADVSKRPVLEISYTTCLVTATNEAIRKSEVSVAPNPFSESFSVNLGTEESATIEIYSQAGQLVYSASANKSFEFINGAQLSQGMYFVKVVKGETAETIKVIKQ